MSEETGVLAVDGAGLAWRRHAGTGPMIVWLGGFASEMTGTKASALADRAAATGRGFLRFDYFGHGESEGDFATGTISRWRADALAMIDGLTHGPLVLVGSSMGGWLASLAAMARPDRIAGLVLIAPAIDFTQGLADASAALREDGARWSILPGPIPIACPVRILQGRRRRSGPLASRPRILPSAAWRQRRIQLDPRRRPPPLATRGHRPADRGGRGSGLAQGSPDAGYILGPRASSPAPPRDPGRLRFQIMRQALRSASTAGRERGSPLSA